MTAARFLSVSALFACSASFAVGCAVSTEPDPSASEADQAAEAAKKLTCPAAPTVCEKGGKCGSIVCTAGQVCEPGATCPPFNPSDPHPCDPILSRCVEPLKKSSCATVRCAAGTHCELTAVYCIMAPCPDKLPACVPDHGCKTNADCRLFDDYCTGCDCRALSSSQADPVCSGPGVRCLREPCGGLAAHCDAGKCVAR